MGKEDFSKIRKENDELKAQMTDLRQELKTFKERIESSPSNGELQKSVSYVSDEIDDIRAKDKDIKRILEDVKRFEDKLELLHNNIQKLCETIEAIQQYSYQYNLKILGVPTKSDRNETAQETTSICVNIFKEMNVQITDKDIDIAHRVASRNRNYSDPIICKFVRRIVKEEVLKQRQSVNDVDLAKLGLTQSNDQGHRIIICEHLTPYQQELFTNAKSFKQMNGFKYCWVKNQSILLRESENSHVIRIKCLQDLQNLRGDFTASNGFQKSWPSLPPPSEVFSGPVLQSSFNGSFRGSSRNNMRGQRGSFMGQRITRSMTSYS